MRAPVSACLIVRDDEHLEAAVASIRPYVTEVCILDTGSSTDTLNVVARIADKWASLTSCNNAEGRIADFSAARDASFALASQPWILWLDSDDLVEGGDQLDRLIREAERTRDGRDVRIFAPYEYAYDFDGDCRLLQRRERIVNADAFGWERPIHEGLVPHRPTRLFDIHTDLMVWKHQRQYTDTDVKAERDADRNQRILLASEHRVDPRWLYDMGTEQAARAQVESDQQAAVVYDANALELLQACHGLSKRREEAAHASLQCGDIAFRQALRATLDRGLPFDGDAAAGHIHTAMLAAPEWDQPYFDLAKLHYVSASAAHVSDAQSKRHAALAMHFARTGLSMPEPRTTWPVDPLNRSLRAHEILHDCLARTGDLDGALAHVEVALEAKPRSAHLLTAKRHYESTQCRERIVADLTALRRAGGIDDAALELLREGLENPGKFKDAIRRGLPAALPSNTGALRIAFSCGATLDTWNPAVLAADGLGGSETAVIEMAKRLAAMGHEVTVYGNIGDEKTYDGVAYKRAGKVYTSAPVDILVAWRNAALLEEDAGPASVGARILWVHDIDPVNATYARLLKADRVFALSAWHRSHLIEAHHLAGSHVVQTRNGIDLTRFDQKVPRNPHKAIYSSSPDRGLAQLLEMWPQIRASVPDAELHVFYGFDLAEKVARETWDAAFTERLAGLKASAAELPGVVLRGKVDQHTLAREMLSAGAWLYPSVLHDGEPFCETSCISAMEAQAAGLAIVTASHGALGETAAHAAIVDSVDPENYSPEEWSARFAIAARMCLQESGALPKDRTDTMAYARESFSWDPVAEQWDVLFKALLEEKQDVVLPAYSEAAE